MYIYIDVRGKENTQTDLQKCTEIDLEDDMFQAYFQEKDN